VSFLRWTRLAVSVMHRSGIRPSICLSVSSFPTLIGAARDAISVRLRSSIGRTDILVLEKEKLI